MPTPETTNDRSNNSHPPLPTVVIALTRSFRCQICKQLAMDSYSSSPSSQISWKCFTAHHAPVHHDAAGASAPLVCAASSDPGRSHVLMCPILRVSHVSAYQEQAIADLIGVVGPADRYLKDRLLSLT